MAERPGLTPYSPSISSERSEEEIRQDIAARRESITDTVDRLSDRFQQTFDWKSYVSDHPLVALGVAAGAGFLAARILLPRRSASGRIKDALADSIEDLTGRFQKRLDHVMPHPQSGLGGALKAAVTGLFTKAATDYLQNKFVDQVIGGNGHYERYSERESEYEPKFERDLRSFDE